MRLLLTLGDHFKFLNECLRLRPTTARIATFGLWAGITPSGADTREWGEKYRSETREFLETMRRVPKVNMLVGNYEYKSCKGKNTACYDCEKQYVMGLIRLINHAEAFPEFKWRIATGSHVKCALFLYGDEEEPEVKGIVGGRNMTDSSWADVTVELDKMSILRLENHFDTIWKSAHLLNSDRIGTIMEEQGISQETVDGIMASI